MLVKYKIVFALRIYMNTYLLNCANLRLAALKANNTLNGGKTEDG